jgi:hypothetical protein
MNITPHEGRVLAAPVTLREASRQSGLLIEEIIVLIVWPFVADVLGHPEEDGMRWGLGEDDIIYVDLDDILMFARVWPSLKESIEREGQRS